MGCCVSTPAGAGADGAAAAAEKFQQQDGKASRKRELGMETLTAEGKADALLAVIPGRMAANGASNNACVFTQQGRKGTNQDAMVVWEGFAAMEDTVFCGVFDGHGPFGHLVARRVRDSVPSKLVHYWQEEVARHEDDRGGKQQGGGGDAVAELGSTDVANTGYGAREASAPEEHRNGGERREEGTLGGPPPPPPPDGAAKEHPMFEPWKESHLTAYRVMDKELRSHPGIDCFCSGTTAVTVLKQGKHLVIGNVGDSRAILGTKDENGAYTAVQLTVDLKPNLPREAERIRQCRGRVFALHDEPEVPRVWLPFDDSPGLAMARAFGDFCLKDYGVIAVPEMTHRRLTERDQFIVLATDGIWDVLSNDEVVQVIAQAPTRATAARALVESAVRVWRLKYPTSKVDDCAVVCLYVDKTFAVPERLKSEEFPPPVPARAVNPGNGHPRPANAMETSGGLQATATNGAASQDPQTSYSSGGGEISNGEEPKGAAEKKRPKPQRKLADWLGADAEEEEEWSALEGVTRVNSLLNLPRFLAGDKRAGKTSQPRPS